MSDQLSDEQNLPKNLPYTVRSEVNQRDKNEDSFQISQIVPIAGQKPITILAVADGMGGHAYGEIVSIESLKKVIGSLHKQLVVEPSINRLENPQIDNEQTLSKALKEALKEANAHVKRMVEANKWGKAGSTIVVAAVLNDIAVVANLGDSPLFHYQTNSKQFRKITEDHTVAGVLLRFGRISPEMARYHEGRHRLEFFVGCPDLPEDDPIYLVNLAQGDMLLLCSDGVSASFSEEEIGKIFVESCNEIEKVADGLIKASTDAGETDNQTLIIWKHHLTEKTTTTSEPYNEKGGFKTLVQSSHNVTKKLAKSATSKTTLDEKNSESEDAEKAAKGELKENSETAKSGDSVNQSDFSSTITEYPKQQEEEKEDSTSVSSNEKVTEDNVSEQKEETSSNKSKKTGEESSKKTKKNSKKNEEKSKNDDDSSADLKE